MNSIEIISYVTGAVAFLAFTVLLLLSWHGRRVGVLLMLASGVSILWGGLLGYAGWQETIPVSWIFIAEFVRYGVWLSFVLALLGPLNADGMIKGIRLGVHTLWIVLVLYCLWSASGLSQTTPIRFVLGAPLAGMLILSLAGLVLLEQIYRNVQPEQRWALKFLVIALGVLFVYDFLLYSYAALYQHMNQGLWAARGFINALAVPLLAVAAARNPDWSLKMAVSRRVVFYSSSLTAATIYIAATVAGGYYVRLYGGSWGRVAEITFWCCAGILLVVLATSGQIRSRLRMFLHKNFFNYRHDYHEEWLRLTATLSDGSGDLSVRATQAIAQIMDSPAGTLFTRHETGEFTLDACWNMPRPVDMRISAGTPPFEFMRERRWIYELGESPPMGDARLTMAPELTGLPQAWLIVPLILDTRLMGFVVLAHARARRKIDWEDIDLLRTAGCQVASTLAQAENARRLSEARQFEGFNRLTAFVMHDIKNLVAQLSLLTKNAERHRQNQAFVDDMLATVANCVRRMTALLEQLRGEKPSGLQSRVRLHAVVEKVLSERASQAPQPVYVPAAEDFYVLAEPERLAAVLGHVIRNGQDAARETGHVSIRLRREGKQAAVTVEDDGEGMDDDFIRNRLFEPFFTTKSSKGMGIGAYQAREYVHSLGGEVSVQSTVGRGTVFTLLIPLAPSPDEVVEPSGLREAS